MTKTNVLALARREAAASINWPEKTAVLLNPDPALRKRLRNAAVIVGIVAALAALCIAPSGPLQHWAHSVDNRALRPNMESAMNSGNLAAGTWLATHYWKDYPGLLQKESDAGDPTAMYLIGRMLLLSDHPGQYLTIDRSLNPPQLKAKGLELIRKAAAAGNQDALRAIINHGGA